MRAACSAVAGRDARARARCVRRVRCGEGQSKVCDAKADIGKQVDELNGVIAATVTKDGVTQNLDAIKTDLQDISDAQSDLSSDRRSKAETANKAFTSSVQGIASQLGSSLSASDAKAGVVTALDQLAASYQKAFAPVNCD
jgi:hypothetical protein